MKGFTLIEVVVVMGITVLLTGFMIQNFSRTRVDLNQSRLLVQDAIREAQSLALAGSVYAGSGKFSSYRCGYGVHFESGSYLVFAGPDAAAVDCSAQDRAYNPGTDDIVRTALFSNNTVEIALPAPDIFFEPPNPATYICSSLPCGDAMRLPGLFADINVRRKGASGASKCPSEDCRTIHVTTSGLITTQ